MPTSTAIPLTLKWAARCCSTATLHYVPLSAFLTEPSCYRTVDSPKLFWREVVSKQKPRSEWRGWEISFKQALLLRAEGAIRAFFVGYYLGDSYAYILMCGNREAIRVRNDAIPRTTTFHKPPFRRYFHNFHKKKRS